MRDTIARLLAIDWPVWFDVFLAIVAFWVFCLLLDGCKSLFMRWMDWRERSRRKAATVKRIDDIQRAMQKERDDVLAELARDAARRLEQYPTEVPRAARTSIRTVARHSALSRGPSAGPDQAA